jgi:hypothetical protein
VLKKVLAVTLLLVTALCFTACPDNSIPGLLPPADLIIEKVPQAMSDVKTYQFELDMSIDMALEAEDEAYGETITMELGGTFDLENREMMMDVFVSLVMFAGGVEMSGEMYLIDDMLYAMNEDPELGSTWSKVEMPEGYWEEVSQIEPQVELLKAVQVEVVGSENVKGVDCYILNLIPDVEQLWQLAMQQSGVTGEEMLPDIDVESFQDIFKYFSLKQWIAKDTYFLIKAEMNIAMELTPETLSYPEEDGLMTMDIAMYLLAYNYNQPVSIVLPDGAEEAIGALE